MNKETIFQLEICKKLTEYLTSNTDKVSEEDLEIAISAFETATNGIESLTTVGSKRVYVNLLDIVIGVVKPEWDKYDAKQKV